MDATSSASAWNPSSSSSQRAKLLTKSPPSEVPLSVSTITMLNTHFHKLRTCIGDSYSDRACGWRWRGAGFALQGFLVVMDAEQDQFGWARSSCDDEEYKFHYSF